MPQQAVQHAGQAAKQARAAKQVLGKVGHQAEQQAQPNEIDAALTHFNASPQFPVPQAVHGDVQETEVNQHRGEQSPPLPGGQAIRQRCELDVLPADAEIEKRQPAEGREVFTQLRHHRDDDAQQQNRGSGRTVAQLLDKAGARHRLRALNDRQLMLGITLRETLIQATHIVSDAVWRPHHLLARLFTDAMRHLQALEQADKAT